MNTAIILNGNVRTLDACKHNLIETFSHLNPDYFASTYNNIFGYHPYVQDTLKYREDPIISTEEIAKKYDIFNLKGIIIDDKDTMDMFYKTQEHLMPISMRHKSSFLQYNKILKGLQLINNYSKKYDVIIKTRCDVWHSKKVTLNQETISSEIIVANGNVYPNDCTIIGTAENMNNIINFICDQFYKGDTELVSKNPPHGMLQAAIEYYKLNTKVQSMMSHVVRVNTNQYY